MGGVWLEVVGWFGSGILVLSLLQTELRRLRMVNLLGCVILLGYNAVLAIWPMVGLNLVLAVVNIWYLARMGRVRHDPSAYEVLWVANDDSYLRHVLRVHEADILKYIPGFVHDPAGPGESYLVLTGNETVGVVVLLDEGDDEGRVLLDYVTPRYRDRTPGEFVFGPRGPVRQRHWRRVRTPDGLVEPYYDELGFRREGNHFVLDLV